MQKIVSKAGGKINKSAATLDTDMQHMKWSSKRLSILNRYTTNEKLSITTSFLPALGATGAETSRSIIGYACKIKLMINFWH